MIPTADEDDDEDYDEDHRRPTRITIKITTKMVHRLRTVDLAQPRPYLPQSSFSVLTVSSTITRPPSGPT